MALQFEYQTAAEFVSRFRDRYRNSTRQETAKMAHWLYMRYVAGDITIAQIRNAFGLDTQQKWDAFLAKVTALKDAWQQVDEAQGE